MELFPKLGHFSTGLLCRVVYLGGKVSLSGGRPSLSDRKVSLSGRNISAGKEGL